MTNLHNDLIDLAENDFKDLKFFEAKIFEKGDHADFLYFAVMLLHKTNFLKEEMQKPWGGYNPSKPNQFKFRRYIVLKRNIMLGVGTEYLLKAIFLKNEYGINKIKNKHRLIFPYKLNNTTRNFLDQCETVTFWILKENIEKIIDFSSFDNTTKKENDKFEQKEKMTKKPSNLTRLYYKIPNSKGCLNLIYGIRNNYSHNAFIKSEFNGFINNAFNFLNFLTQLEFGKNIEELYEDYKPEGD